MESHPLMNLKYVVRASRRGPRVGINLSTYRARMLAFTDSRVRQHVYIQGTRLEPVVASAGFRAPVKLCMPRTPVGASGGSTGIPECTHYTCTMAFTAVCTMKGT